MAISGTIENVQSKDTRSGLAMVVFKVNGYSFKALGYKAAAVQQLETYRLTWYSQASQAWLRGKIRLTTTTKATSITVSQTDHPLVEEPAPTLAA